MSVILDFSLLPNLNHVKARFAMESDVAEKMRRFPNVLDRAENAIRFCWFVSNIEGVLKLEEPRLIRLREGFLRAALAEFVSMEDMLEYDLQLANLTDIPLKCSDSKKPLLHIIRELRNLEIHLYSSILAFAEKEVLWGKVEEPEKAHQIQIDIWTIEALTESKFLQLRNANRYSSEDRQNLIRWFNLAQLEWGIHYLVFLAIEEYCQEILQNHLPK